MCCMLIVVCSSLLDARCSLIVVVVHCRSLFVVWCSLFVVRCLLFGVCRSLFIVR